MDIIKKYLKGMHRAKELCGDPDAIWTSYDGAANLQSEFLTSRYGTARIVTTQNPDRTWTSRALVDHNTFTWSEIYKICTPVTTFAAAGHLHKLVLNESGVLEEWHRTCRGNV